MTIPGVEEQLRQRDARIAKQAAQIKEQAARIKELEREIEELKKLLVERAKSKESKPPKEATNYSVARHERRQQRRRHRKKSTGRKPKDAKCDCATQTIHWNPRKHKLVGRVRDWPWSSFHRLVAEGQYDIDWGGTDPEPVWAAPEWGE